jgi:hypothetical protein
MTSPLGRGHDAPGFATLASLSLREKGWGERSEGAAGGERNFLFHSNLRFSGKQVLRDIK